MANQVFISHASEDHGFVLRLAAALQERGVSVWIDNWDIPPGANWELTVEDALYASARFLIVLSPASVRSPEVRGELRTALEENKPILPVLYQKCRIPYRLRPIQYVDFRDCSPDDEAGLADVLRALGMPGPAPPTREVREEEEIPTERQPFEPEMVLIPAGQFPMGSDPQVDADAEENEQPQHTLFLPDYQMARTPVTNAQYLAFVQAVSHQPPDHWQGGQPPRGRGDHPVVWVSWHDAMAYCRWLAEVTGRSYCLPSETEWEKGARGADGRIYPWGNEWDAARCNTREGGKRDPTPVEAYPRGASPYGLLDMAGNVWEWTGSVYWDYPYDPRDGREDLEAGDDALRVVRGGSVFNGRESARCTARLGYLPDLRIRLNGFRVCVVAQQE